MAAGIFERAETDAKKHLFLAIIELTETGDHVTIIFHTALISPQANVPLC